LLITAAMKPVAMQVADSVPFVPVVVLCVFIIRNGTSKNKEGFDQEATWRSVSCQRQIFLPPIPLRSCVICYCDPSSCNQFTCLPISMELDKRANRICASSTSNSVIYIQPGNQNDTGNKRRSDELFFKTISIVLYKLN
jgi:hypothetical protein